MPSPNSFPPLLGHKWYSAPWERALAWGIAQHHSPQGHRVISPLPQLHELCPSYVSDWDVPFTQPRASHLVRQWAETAVKVSLCGGLDKHKFFVTLPTKKWTFLLSQVWAALMICFTQ